jgi:hypothetical protein
VLSDDAVKVARMIYDRAGYDDRALPPIRVRPVQRGRWSGPARNIITLPVWLWDERPCFREYYIAHELAHALVGYPGHHWPFQLMLWSLAPDLWHYECSYKPRQYSIAHATIVGRYRPTY